jgi:hypothetical protein
MPMAADAQTEDAAIQHPPQIHMAIPLGLGRVALREDRLDHLSKPMLQASNSDLMPAEL